MLRIMVIGLTGLALNSCSAAHSAGGGHAAAAGKAIKGSVPPAGSVGLNVSIVAAIYPEIPFVDVFKETQPWIFEKQGGYLGASASGRSTVSNEGWVKTLAPDESAKACAFQDKTGHYPGGLYTLLYDGAGDLTVTGPVTIVSRAPGEMKVQVNPTSGEPGPCIVENSTNSSDPIRNIRFIMPGFETTYRSNPFYPPFVNEFKPFKVVRFLDWSRVNRSKVVNWSDRRPQNYATQAMSVGAAGASPTPPVTMNDVAIEYQIDFANLIGANPWFLTPIMASDDYIRHMAQLVRQRLRPDLHPMIELSNEVWNGRFSQYKYSNDMGDKAHLDLFAAPNHSKAGMYWYAERSTQMFDIWNDVYGSDAHRITHIVSWWYKKPDDAEAILGYKDTYKKVDVLAVGGYVRPYNFYKITTPSDLDVIAKSSVDTVMDKIVDNMAELDGQLAKQNAVAKKFGVSLVVYEGGFDFDHSQVPDPYQKPINDLLAAASRSPRMGDLYKEWLRHVTADGVVLFNHFDDVGPPGAYGSFGALEYQDQDPATSAKYSALIAYMAAHPVTWAP